MPYNRLPNRDAQNPGFLCQSIIDAAYYHSNDNDQMTRAMYEGFKRLHDLGITPRADSKSGYLLMVAGEDKHVYAETRVGETLRRAQLIERINNFKMPDVPPLSPFFYDSVMGDICVLAQTI